jgi:centromeric protein E
VISPWHPPSNHGSDGIEPYHIKESPSRTTSEVSEEHCREVQCIEIHEHVRSRSQEFNQLLPEDTKSQTPDVEVISKDAVPQPDEQQGLKSVTKKIEDHVRSYSSKDEQQVENIRKIEEDSVKTYQCEFDRITENVVKLYTCDANHSFDIAKTPHECLSLKRCIMSSKDRALARSKSCRATFMVIPNSWFDDFENTSRTPPDEMFRYAPRRLDKVRRSLYDDNGDCQNEDFKTTPLIPEKNDYQNEDCLLDCSTVSCEVASDKVFNDMSTSDEVAKEMSTSDEEQETPVNDISCVTEAKENTEDCHEDLLEELQAHIIMVRVDSSYIFLPFMIPPGSLTVCLKCTRN